MLNFLLRPDDLMTSPNCPSYNFEIIQTMCSEMPCSNKFFQSAGQWARSIAFDRSKLTTRTGKFYPGKHFAVKKYVTNSSKDNFVVSNVRNRIAWRISNPRVCARHFENPHQHSELSDASFQALLPQHTTNEDSLHILVARFPWYKANLHQHCFVQSAMSRP